MKCRRCGDRAVINMRQHKLALCKQHYLEWLPEQTERFICKYQMFTRNERVLVAVSGGKDSLALWDILIQLGYEADGLYIDLGIGGECGYSDASYRKVRQFVDGRRGLRLEVVDVEESLGASIPVAATHTNRGKGRPCAVCGLSKRHIMNRVARDGGYQVLATGHNLDDEAAVLFGNVLTWQLGYLARQGPVLPEQDGLIRKVKPLCRFYEREMAAYAILTRIDYIYDECPYAVGATSFYYKEVLNQIEAKRPGAKLQFYLNFLQAKEEGAFQATEESLNLTLCTSCSQPTTVDGQCAFCRMWDRVREGVESQSA